MLRLLLLFIILESVLSDNKLHLGNLCLASEKNCTGLYDSNKKYKVDCVKICPSKFPYLCGVKKERCSVDKSTCKKYEYLSGYQAFFTKSFIQGENLKKLLDFNKFIRKCPLNKRVWNAEHICLNKAKCFLKNTVKIQYINIPLVKKQHCPCPKKFGFHCGKNIF